MDELEMSVSEAFEKYGIGNRDKSIKVSFRTKTGKLTYSALHSWFSVRTSKVVYQLIGERNQKVSGDSVVIVRIEAKP